MRLGLLFLSACSFQPGVAEPPPEDAEPIPDTFVATSCPNAYSVVFGTSRYRVITAGTKAWLHSDDCTGDLAGATHLAAIDSIDELRAMEAAIDAVGGIAGNKAWVGGVQLRSQASPTAGWLSVTGGPLIANGWDQGEPNDTTIEDNRENFAGLERDRQGLVDFPSNDDYGAICECDGKPLAPDAAAAIDANRQ